MITKSGDQIPDEMLIGMTRGEWPIKLFYQDESASAEWLAGDAIKRRVYRVRLTPIQLLSYKPPIPASLVPEDISGGYADDGQPL
jgi:hypothetical protein